MASKCITIWFYCYWVILATALIDAQLDGKRCSKEGESGRDCRGILRPVGKRLSRAGGIPYGSYLCERHRYRVLQEDSTRSCPSSWGHSKFLHLYPIPERLFQIFDSVGRTREGYIPGTRWCNLCKEKANEEFKSMEGFLEGLSRKVRRFNFKLFPLLYSSFKFSSSVSLKKSLIILIVFYTADRRGKYNFSWEGVESTERERNTREGEGFSLLLFCKIKLFCKKPAGIWFSLYKYRTEILL